MTDYKALEQDYGLALQPKRDVVAVRGKGALLYDENGREYIDFAAGIAVASLGHCHPKLVAAIQQQAETLITCPNIMYNDVRSRLLQKLVEVSPTNLTRAYLCNSGAESIEAALKFARLHTGRSNFVTAMRGFHGRTMGAVSATLHPKYRAAFPAAGSRLQLCALQQDRQARSRDRRQHRRRHARAGAGRRRGQPGAGGLHRRRARTLHRAWRNADRRRNPDRFLPHRPHVFACEHFELRARPDVPGQGAWAPAYPIGATLMRDDAIQRRNRPARHHFRRQPAGRGRRAGRDRRLPDRKRWTSAPRELGEYFEAQLQTPPTCRRSARCAASA